jgi:hypothetical protein
VKSEKSLSRTGTRRWLVSLAAVGALLLLSAQAAAHGGEKETHHFPWASFLSLAVGTLSLGGGLYLDRKGTDRRELSDVAVLGGVCAIVLSAALYWLV